ncbi:MAG: CTP synthase [Treponema sp.]|nr:CTP synthase [Treponema sp.]
MTKFIFVTGGVCSSLGKGVAASSLGALLESRGFNVRMIKCDPYINVNAGNQSPFVHGEIYVTDDGAQTDLDLGNYARFTSGPLSQANSITTGQVYDSVIRREREGGYNGLCVQVIPHITDEIKARILAVAKEDEDTDISIVEIGGTVGDIECIPYLEAARQLIHESGHGNAISAHLTLIPEVGEGELKTKPTQHSVKAMQEMGIQPDVLICRSPVMLDKDTCRKIALFCNVGNDSVFTCVNVTTTIYEIPLMFYEQKLDQVVLTKLGIAARHANIKPWRSVMDRVASRKGKLKIGIVGKYMELHDAYQSVYEALFHASLECGVEVELFKINSDKLEKADSADTILGKSSPDGGVDGILIPAGSGQKGTGGMILAAEWARKNKIPYLGISLGMQIMAIEWGKNVLGWKDADSTEFNTGTKHPVIALPENQDKTVKQGGASRLGKYTANVEAGTRLYAAYGTSTISERHRHRYEFSNQYREEMIKSGLILGAINPEKNLVEAIEWPNHPWGLGVLFHPEFKSKPTAASPIFREFITAARELKTDKK